MQTLEKLPNPLELRSRILKLVQAIDRLEQSPEDECDGEVMEEMLSELVKLREQLDDLQIEDHVCENVRCGKVFQRSSKPVQRTRRKSCSEECLRVLKRKWSGGPETFKSDSHGKSRGEGC